MGELGKLIQIKEENQTIFLHVIIAFICLLSTACIKGLVEYN